MYLQGGYTEKWKYYFHFIKLHRFSPAKWHKPVICKVWWPRQEDLKFKLEVSLGQRVSSRPSWAVYGDPGEKGEEEGAGEC